jgi:hypothetical protein
MPKDLNSSHYTPYASRDGQEITIVRKITEPEPGYDQEVLPMYLGRFPDGVEGGIFPDELVWGDDEKEKPPSDALKMYRELAGTIANQAEAIAEGKIPADQLAGQVALLKNNIDTLQAWTKHGWGS